MIILKYLWPILLFRLITPVKKGVDRVWINQLYHLIFEPLSASMRKKFHLVRDLQNFLEGQGNSKQHAVKKINW